MLKRYTFDKDSTVVLDFACNAGKASLLVIGLTK